ncbi:MAG: hypothetical protein GEU99_03125 [Luteitalea sp.]|nr:hypothetical protein [Luteitalea sp.]
MVLSFRWVTISICVWSLAWVCPASVRAAAASAAQEAAAGSLVVEVSDALEGVLPGATVTLVGPLPGETRTFEITSGRGEVLFDDLVPGRYRLRVELASFELAEVDEVEIRAGRRTRHEVTLSLSGFTDEVVVGEEAAGRRLSDSFSDTMPEEEIEQLPDDPEEMATFLQELAGPDAELRVNGFEDGELPPKSQIQAIRIRSDPFSPDMHSAGRPRVDIITKPGSSTWENRVNIGFRDQSLDARNAFASERGAGQTRRLEWDLSGPLVKNKTSIALEVGGTSAFDAQTIVATRPEGPLSDVVNQEFQQMNVEVRLDHALTSTHTLHAEYQRRTGERGNLGVGQYDLAERAYANEDFRNILRISDMGTFGKKVFNEFRLEYSWEGEDVRSLSDAVTIDVQNAFTEGGAQRGGGSRERELEIENDLEFRLNDQHNMRMGFEAELGRSRTDEWENTSGTFTFASLADYEARRPLQYTQRVGSPLLDYSRYELGWYIYDEIRLQENLQLGLGLRHEFQSHLADWNNFAPRVSVGWTPGGDDGNTTLRGGFGISYDWYDTDVYEETLLVDGVQQRDLIIRNPGWPDPLAGSFETEGPPPSRVQAAEDLVMPTRRRISVGVEHELTDALELGFNVFDEVTSNQFRGLNINAPIDGERPYPEFGRITEVRSIGRETERGFDLRLRVRSEERRLFGFARYRYSREMNDGEGALSLPADSYDLAAEWSPAGGDIRHRIFGSVSLRLPYGLGVGLRGDLSSGAPYTIRTGFDDNGDTVTNDRPAGVGRNTERGSWQRDADLRLSWRSDDGPERRGRRDDRNQPRRGLELYIQVRNLFNTTNFTNYSGVVTSPYFGQPTAAGSGRRLELGTRLFF